jgi:hypothetical protein
MQSMEQRTASREKTTWKDTSLTSTDILSSDNVVNDHRRTPTNLFCFGVYRFPWRKVEYVYQLVPACNYTFAILTVSRNLLPKLL